MWLPKGWNWVLDWYNYVNGGGKAWKIMSCDQSIGHNPERSPEGRRPEGDLEGLWPMDWSRDIIFHAFLTPVTWLSFSHKIKVVIGFPDINLAYKDKEKFTVHKFILEPAGYIFLSLSNLSKWLGADKTSLHTGLKLYLCTNCHKAFLRVFKLQAHIRVHMESETIYVLIVTSLLLIVSFYRDTRWFIENKNHHFWWQCDYI